MSYGITSRITGLTPPRLGNLMAYSFLCSEFPGVMAEFGCFNGGSLELLARIHPTKTIYGIDSFEGMPKSDPANEDTHLKGDFALSSEEYRDLLIHFKDFHPNVKILKGFSPGIFNSVPADTTFSFVHSDADLYSSTKDALEFFYPRLFRGGMMLFDDWGFGTTRGCRKALEEWNEPCTWKGELKFANDIFCGQFLIIK